MKSSERIIERILQEELNVFSGYRAFDTIELTKDSPEERAAKRAGVSPERVAEVKAIAYREEKERRLSKHPQFSVIFDAIAKEGQ